MLEDFVMRTFLSILSWAPIVCVIAAPYEAIKYRSGPILHNEFILFLHGIYTAVTCVFGIPGIYFYLTTP